MAGEYLLGRGRRLELNDQVDIWMQTNVRKTEARRLAAGQFSLLPRLNDSSTFMTVTRRIKARISIQPPDGRLKPE